MARPASMTYWGSKGFKIAQVRPITADIRRQEDAIEEARENHFQGQYLPFCAAPNRAVKLPNKENARIDRTKIVDYLLAVDHQEGAAKAAFFRRFGFAAADWQTFADALGCPQSSED
jgi:hypothetical protein